MNIVNILEISSSVVRRRKYLIAISLLTVIAMLARFKGLTFQSYWYDELFSISAALPEKSFYDVLSYSFSDVHPPLFHLLLWFWFKLFGFSEFSGRAFPAFIGTLCIPAIYLLGKELLDEEVGIYAATFATFNFFLLRYSQEVRPYSLLLLLSTLSLLFYLRTLKTAGKLNLASYILATALLLYTHYYGLIIVAIEFLFLGIYLAANKTHTRRLLVFALISGAALALMLLPIVQSILDDAGKASFWIPPPRSDFIIIYFFRYFGGSLLIMLFFLALMLIGLMKKSGYSLKKPGNFGTLFVILWLVLAYLIPYIQSITSLPTLLLRTTIIAVPAIFFLASFGLAKIRQKSIKTLLFIWFILFSIFHISWQANYYNNITKEQYRDIVLEATNTHPYLPVYTPNKYRDHIMFNNYSKMLGVNLRVEDISILEHRLANGTAGSCFWLVEGHWNSLKRKIQPNGYTKPYGYTIKKVIKKKATAILLSTESSKKSSCGNGK